MNRMHPICYVILAGAAMAGYSYNGIGGAGVALIYASVLLIIFGAFS